MIAKLLFRLGFTIQSIDRMKKCREGRLAAFTADAPVVIITTPDQRACADEIQKEYQGEVSKISILEVSRLAKVNHIKNKLPKGNATIIVVDGLYHHFAKLITHCYNRPQTVLLLWIPAKPFLLAAFIPYFRYSFSYLYADSVVLEDDALASTFRLWHIPCSIHRKEEGMSLEKLLENKVSESNSSSIKLFTKYFQEAQSEIRGNSQVYAQMMPPWGAFRTLSMRFIMKNLNGKSGQLNSVL